MWRSLLCVDCGVDRMRSSCGIKQLSTSKAHKPAPEELELERLPQTSPLARGDSVSSVATSAGDYEAAFDDGVAALDDEDL